MVLYRNADSDGSDTGRCTHAGRIRKWEPFRGWRLVFSACDPRFRPELDDEGAHRLLARACDFDLTASPNRLDQLAHVPALPTLLEVHLLNRRAARSRKLSITAYFSSTCWR